MSSSTDISRGHVIPAGAGPALRLVPEPVPQPAGEPLQIPWKTVTALRRTVATIMAEWTNAQKADQKDKPERPDQKSGPDDGDTRVYGRQVVTSTVREWVAEQMRTGASSPSKELERAIATAVFDAAFGLGRLEEVLRDERVENFEANGCDDTWISYDDGRVVKGSPIAESDADLIADLQQWASRANRTFSRLSKPTLHLELADGSRLAAMIETTRRPSLVVRRHRMVNVTLADLVGSGMISKAMAAFLAAVVRSNANVVLTGPPNAGKTTLLRAMAREIPAMERYATLETEYELHLDRLGQHPRMLALQTKEGNNERDADGRPTGEVTLSDLVQHSLRMNFARLIVGEVRGAEVLPMLEAVSTGGKGSICTIHANSAHHAFERIVSLCLSRAGMTEEFAYRLAGGSISYVVNVTMVDESLSGTGGRRRRFVNQIVEVAGFGEHGRPSYNDVFTPGPDGRGVPRRAPSTIQTLIRAGLDPGWFGGSAGDGGWTAASGPQREPSR